MTLFFVGILEMIIVTVWTKVVTKTQVLASGLITIVNILIWYYVLETIVSNLNQFSLVMLYALGCAVGTMVSTYFFGRQEKRSRIKSGLKKLVKEAEENCEESLVSKVKAY